MHFFVHISICRLFFHSSSFCFGFIANRIVRRTIQNVELHRANFKTPHPLPRGDENPSQSCKKHPQTITLLFISPKESSCNPWSLKCQTFLSGQNGRAGHRHESLQTSPKIQACPRSPPFANAGGKRSPPPNAHTFTHIYIRLVFFALVGESRKAKPLYAHLPFAAPP